MKSVPDTKKKQEHPNLNSKAVPMNTVFDPDKWKNKNSKSQAWYTAWFMKKTEQDQSAYQNTKKEKMIQRHSVRMIVMRST